MFSTYFFHSPLLSLSAIFFLLPLASAHSPPSLGPQPAGTSAPRPAPARSRSTIGKHEKLSIVYNLIASAFDNSCPDLHPPSPDLPISPTSLGHHSLQARHLKRPCEEVSMTSDLPLLRICICSDLFMQLNVFPVARTQGFVLVLWLFTDEWKIR